MTAASAALLLALCLLGLLGCAAGQSSAGPVVTSVSGCVDVGSMTVNCSLPVFVTVRGSGFLTNINSMYSSSPLSYINPQLELSPQAVAAGVQQPYMRASGLSPVNDTYFVFQIVYLGQGVYADGVPLSLTVSLGQAGRPQITSEPFVAVSISSAPPPVISAISGCPVVSADGQSVSQCLPDLHVLTLYRVRLLAVAAHISRACG